MTTPRLGRSIACALALMALLASGACGHSDPFSTFDKEGSVEYQDRPSMETMLDRYRDFQDDLLGQLDEHFGKRTWAQPSKDLGFDWGDCGDPDFPDGATVNPPSVGFDGAYPREQWHKVRDLVIKVGKKHGFSDITMYLDRSYALYFTASDPKYGAFYDFGMGKNTGFGITTGCHRWETPPAPVS